MSVATTVLKAKAPKVKAIVGKQKQNGALMYEVEWEKDDCEEYTWRPVAELARYHDMLKDYDALHAGEEIEDNWEVDRILAKLKKPKDSYTVRWMNWDQPDDVHESNFTNQEGGLELRDCFILRTKWLEQRKLKRAKLRKHDPIDILYDDYAVHLDPDANRALYMINVLDSKDATVKKREFKTAKHAAHALGMTVEDVKMVCEADDAMVTGVAADGDQTYYGAFKPDLAPSLPTSTKARKRERPK